jgi:hypothetical protein
VIRRAAAGALVALAALGATGCNVPPVLRTWVNTGATEHATEHVNAGRPDELVLCSLPAQAWEFDIPGRVITDHGWLIRSDAVVAFGCEGAFRRAVGTQCVATGLAPPADIACTVTHVWWGQVDGNPWIIDPPGVLPAAIQEDDPGWNCHTQGNRICGPVT